MFLSSYDFAGPAQQLVESYHRMMEGYPTEELLLNVCVVTGTGITVFDACPDRQTFESFSTSAEFTEALTAVGLPTPTVTPLGDVHGAIVRQPVQAVRA